MPLAKKQNEKVRGNRTWGKVLQQLQKKIIQLTVV